MNWKLFTTHGVLVNRQHSLPVTVDTIYWIYQVLNLSGQSPPSLHNELAVDFSLSAQEDFYPSCCVHDQQNDLLHTNN